LFGGEASHDGKRNPSVINCKRQDEKNNNPHYATDSFFHINKFDGEKLVETN
jgi:hypothetical protein